MEKLSSRRVWVDDESEARIPFGISFQEKKSIKNNFLHLHEPPTPAHQHQGVARSRSLTALDISGCESSPKTRALHVMRKASKLSM